MNNKRMLVIEDDFASQVLYLRTFECLNYHVAVIPDGQEAIHALSSSDDLPEVLLIDINLPCVSGVEIVKFIREKLHRNDLILIIISAYLIPPTHPVRALIDMVVLKPISPYILAQKVEKLFVSRIQVATA